MSSTLLDRWSHRQNGDCLKCNFIKSRSVCEAGCENNELNDKVPMNTPGKNKHSTCSCFLFLICTDIVTQKPEWLSAWAPSVSGNNTFDLKPVHVKNVAGYVTIMCVKHCQSFTPPSCPVLSCLCPQAEDPKSSTLHQWGGRDSLEGTEN